MSKLQTKKKPFKYRINELLINIFGATANRARVNLQDYAGISKATLSADANIKASDAKTIPQARLITYATFFGINVSELVNE